LIPPPKVSVSVAPNPIEIRQGETKRVELQLKSNTMFPASTRIEVRSVAQMGFNYTSQPIGIQPQSVATLPINIKVLDNSAIGPQTIPILINSSFPTELYQNNTSAGAFHLGNIRFKVPSSHANIVNETSDLTVDVQKGPDAFEQMKAFWNAFGGPISLVGGGFAAGAASLIFDRLKKPKSAANSSS
jgi:hypothetical protein